MRQRRLRRMRRSVDARDWRNNGGPGCLSGMVTTPTTPTTSPAGPALTLARALLLMDAAQAAAKEAGIPMAFAVMDPGGHLIALVRMDGAPWIAADIAQGKAWTAAAYGLPSAAQKDKMAAMPAFASAISTLTHGRFTPQTGAIPLFQDGQLVGALGASGGTGDQDEAACWSAARTLGIAGDR